jgi:asparagine synthase (glutamine-hydrolysing)
VFKKSLEPYLSEEILYRKKMGFAVPLASWFRGPLAQRVRDSLLGPMLAETGIFNQQFLHELVEQHQSGRRDYSASIWALLMFDAFLRKEFEGS